MSDFISYAQSAAEKFKVDPGIFSSLINSESGFNPTAINKSGAYGIAQITAATASNPGYGMKPLVNRDDPKASLNFAAEYFSKLTEKYKGDYTSAIAAYKGFGNDLNSGLSHATAVLEDAKNFITSGGKSKWSGASINDWNSEAPAVVNDKSIWQYNASDLTDFFKRVSIPLTIGGAGVLIISFSIIALFFIKKGE